MGWRTLEDQPRGRLAHHTGSSHSFWTGITTRTYLWFSVWWAEEGLRGPGVFFFPRGGHSVRR